MFHSETLNNSVTVSPGAFNVIFVNPLKFAGVITTLFVPAVDTFINVPIKWTGVLFSELIGSITINSGQSCGSSTLGGAIAGEEYSTMNFTGDISPSSYGTQDYEPGSDVDSPFCLSC